MLVLHHDAAKRQIELPRQALPSHQDSSHLILGFKGFANMCGSLLFLFSVLC